MTAERAAIGRDSTPVLPRGVRLRFDEARGAWVLLGPEKILVVDETGLAILQRCTGTATVGAIIDDLSRAFEAGPDEIGPDVIDYLQDLSDRGMLKT